MAEARGVGQREFATPEGRRVGWLTRQFISARSSQCRRAISGLLRLSRACGAAIASRSGSLSRTTDATVRRQGRDSGATILDMLASERRPFMAGVDHERAE